MEDLNVRFQVSGDVNQLQVAPMIFIAFVENAFKYASQTSGDTAELHVLISLDGRELHFHCENTYEARSDTHDRIPGDSSGLGIKNARAILEISYPDQHSLTIREESGLFKVDLRIDLSR